MVKKRRTAPEEGTNEPFADKDYAHLFFDYRGLVRQEFVPHGTTANAAFYKSVLKRLREKVRRKRLDLWRDQSWLLHHDNARPHTALMIQEFLSRNSLPTVPQPPYSPNLSPADFFPSLV